MQQTKTQEIPVKVYRSANRVTIAAPMPGLEPQNIGIDVKERTVVLHGDLRGMLKDDKEVLVDEWNPGPYEREVTLPQAVDGELANVTYNNGVVVVVLPCAQNTRPAHLTLDAVSPTQGERVGNFGHPIRDAHEEPGA
jgi:HSP20 family protein